MGCYSSCTETDSIEEKLNTTSYSQNSGKGLVKVGDMFYRESDIVNNTYTNPTVRTMFSGKNETPRDSEYDRAAYNVLFPDTASCFSDLTEQAADIASFNNLSYTSEHKDQEKATFTNKTAVDSLSCLIEQSDLEKSTFTNSKVLESPSLLREQMDLERATFINTAASESQVFEKRKTDLEKGTYTNMGAMSSHFRVTEEANVKASDSPFILTKQTDREKNVTVVDCHLPMENPTELEGTTYANVETLNSPSILVKQQTNLKNDTLTTATSLLTNQTDLEKATFTNELYANYLIKLTKQADKGKLSLTNSLSESTEQVRFNKAALTNKGYERIRCDNVKLPPDFVFVKPINSPAKTGNIPRRKLSYQHNQTSSYRDFMDLPESSDTKHAHIYDEIDIIPVSPKTRSLAVNRTYMSLSDDCIFSVSNDFKKNNSFKRKSNEVEPINVYESIAPNVKLKSSSE